LQGQGIETVDAAVEQLQFDFGDGFAAAVRGNPAAVELDLDAGARIGIELPEAAAKVGFEDGGEASGDLVPLQQLAQARLVDAGKIEVVEVGRLPLRPARQAAVGLPLALDHLLPGGAVLAQAQQDAGAAQGHAPGVVIDADQLVLRASGRGTQYGIPEQGAVAVLGDRQF
jgi:hypothetical protein